jgi:hypothetical protein
VDKEILDTISTLLISLALIAFAAYLVTSVPGATADNIAMAVVTLVGARWLQQGAQKSAERQAEKIQEAVATAQNGN